MRDRPRVLLLETIDDEAQALLTEQTEVVLSPSTDAGVCMELARDGATRAIVTRGKGRVTAELMDACEGLVAVARCGVGLDNVDVPAATQRGVKVLNLPGSNAQTIAEHTVMLMLGLSRGLVPWANAVREGGWETRGAYSHDEVRGKTVGVIGLGNIGSRVAGLCAAFGMRVVYTDPVERDAPHERMGLDELLGGSDVVTLHCQLDDSSRGMIDRAALGRMKRGTMLINTARGGLIDHAALAESLRSGHLGGFAADVLDVEPPDRDNPLLGMPNVVLTPHVGSLTRTTYREMCVRSVENVLAVVEGREVEAGCVFNGRELA